MSSKSLIIFLAAGTALVAGKTPSGFSPASNTDLVVTYGQTAAMNGVVVDKAATASEPTIATQSQLNGTSFAVIMVDLDIPSNQSPHTFLHWVQTDLTPSTTASTITTSGGSVQAFTLTNSKSASAIVAYTQPGPPAQNPLSHRYTQILIDTTSASSTAISTLQQAAQTRTGFDVAAVLQTAGLTSNVVAGNSFNVTNPGPASSENSNAASNSTASATGSGGKKKGSKTRTGAGSEPTGHPSGKGSGGRKGSGSAKTTKAGSTPTSAGSVAGATGAAGASTGTNTTNTGTSSGNGTVSTSDASATAAISLYSVSLFTALMSAVFSGF